MGDDPPPPPPPPVQYPSPPSPTELTRDSLAAQAEFAPQFLDLNKQLGPQYAQLQTDIAREQAPQLSEINLQNQKVYGPQLIQAAIDNLKLADPTGFQVRQTLGQQAADDLARNGAMSPDEERLAQQDYRAAQQARGTGTGVSDAFDEAAFLAQNRYARAQQAKTNASAFLAGQQPQNSFAGLNQAGQTANTGTQNVNPFLAMAPSTNALIGAQMQGFGINSNNIAAQNALANNQYQFGVSNTTNPFLTGTGILMSGAGTASRFFQPIQFGG